MFINEQTGARMPIYYMPKNKKFGLIQNVDTETDEGVIALFPAPPPNKPGNKAKGVAVWREKSLASGLGTRPENLAHCSWS